MSRLFAALLLGALLSGAAGAADPMREKADFERKLLSASALLAAEKRTDASRGNRRQEEIAAHEAAIDQAKRLASTGDFDAAHQLIDQVLVKEKQWLAESASNPATAGLKSGSAALTRDPQRDANGMTGEDTRNEIERTLFSATALRNLMLRRSQEQGADNSAVLGRIDQLMDDARRLASTDPGRALQLAGSAYETARENVEGRREKQ